MESKRAMLLLKVVDQGEEVEWDQEAERSRATQWWRFRNWASPLRALQVRGEEEQEEVKKVPCEVYENSR